MTSAIAARDATKGSHLARNKIDLIDVFSKQTLPMWGNAPSMKLLAGNLALPAPTPSGRKGSRSMMAVRHHDASNARGKKTGRFDQHETKEHPMNEDTVAGKWKQLSGKIKAKWGKLTDDDMQKAEGNEEYLRGKLQEHYGLAKDKADAALKELADA